MTTQQLIYETAIPVSNARHAKGYVEIMKNYAFARHVNSLPLMAVEFPEATQDYVIVFAGTPENTMPMVILGARQDENLYLNSEGGWQAGYIPAFIRRYPFVFSGSADGKTFTLCVDEAYLGVNFQGRGQALFGEDGKPSPYTDNVLKFLQEYRAQFMRTEVFCKKLRDLDLLEPMQAEFTLGSGEKTALGGFLVVNRTRLKALSAEKLAELAQTDELELIYLHLQSMRNFNVVKDRLVLIQGSKTAQAAAATSNPGASESTADAIAPDDASNRVAPESTSKAAAGRSTKRATAE